MDIICLYNIFFRIERQRAIINICQYMFINTCTFQSTRKLHESSFLSNLLLVLKSVLTLLNFFILENIICLKYRVSSSIGFSEIWYKLKFTLYLFLYKFLLEFYLSFLIYFYFQGKRDSGECWYCQSRVLILLYSGVEGLSSD